jgi:hypothetical protein
MPCWRAALVETGADAAWVGWGFVAEDPAFAEVCEKLGVTFIGPGPDAMRKLGDKIGAKLIAERVGVPVAPWSRGPVRDLDAALRAAEGIGYPLMLKASAGGGGRGIRVITCPEELIDCACRKPHARRVTCTDTGLCEGEGVSARGEHDGRSCACGSSISSLSVRSRGCGWPVGRRAGKTRRSCCSVTRSVSFNGSRCASRG